MMERSWVYRRTAVFFSLVFNAGMLFALLAIGKSDMISITLAQGCFVLFGSTLGAYVFGAEWSDKNKAKEIIQGIASK